VAIKTVKISPAARKDLKGVPNYIVDKLLAWVGRVEQVGIEEVRKLKGFHDEPLQGNRKGQRSIRLSLAYRAIYEIHPDGTAECISIKEVNKHDY
jgi:proteic killer suppression protein